MKRVTRSGGTVALYIWDYGSNMEFLHYFWAAAVQLREGTSNFNEAGRFSSWNHNYLIALFIEAALVDIYIQSIKIDTRFTDFNDYWEPFLGGQGPGPSYLMTLSETERQKLRDSVYQSLAVKKDGSIPLSASALAIKGRVIK